MVTTASLHSPEPAVRRSASSRPAALDVDRAARLGHRVASLPGFRGPETRPASTPTEPSAAVRPAPAIRRSPERRLQRSWQWVEGGRAKNRDLTQSFLGFRDFGITPVILNDIEIPGGDVTTAIHEPPLLVKSLKGGQVEVSIFAEPIQQVGYRMELPADPPWVAMTTVGRAAGFLGQVGFGISDSLRKKGDSDDPVRLEVHGFPNDAKFARLVEVHEDVHVKDLERIVNGILVPWDFKLSQFMEEKRTFTADSLPEAKEMLYKALGGSPKQIGTLFKSTLRDAGLKFHSTKAGGTPTIETTTYIRGNPNVLRIYWAHPLG